MGKSARAEIGSPLYVRTCRHPSRGFHRLLWRTINDPNHGANKAAPARVLAMKLVKWALIGLLVLPALELLAFLAIAALIGALWAASLLVATSYLGIRLLRKFGGEDLDRIRDGVASTGLQAIHVEDPAVARTIGALLLALPGFITDALGAALLMPPLRRRIAATLITASRKRSHPAQNKTLDLTPAEWKEEKRDGREDDDASR
jgi:UPF0716 protein FxsA